MRNVEAKLSYHSILIRTTYVIVLSRRNCSTRVHRPGVTNTLLEIPWKTMCLHSSSCTWSADVWYRSVSKRPPGKWLIQKRRETDQHPCPPLLMKSQEGPGKHRHGVISSSDFFFFSGGSGWISSTPFITTAFLYVYDSFCLCKLGMCVDVFYIHHVYFVIHTYL